MQHVLERDVDNHLNVSPAAGHALAEDLLKEEPVTSMGGIQCVSERGRSHVRSGQGAFALGAHSGSTVPKPLNPPAELNPPWSWQAQWHNAE